MLCLSKTLLADSLGKPRKLFVLLHAKEKKKKGYFLTSAYADETMWLSKSDFFPNTVEILTLALLIFQLP